MQKARRVTCSTTPQSPCSTPTVISRKKLIPTSTEGDSSREKRTLEESVVVKSRPRTTKYNDWPPSSNMAKSLKKSTKPARPPRPNLGSLQNVVVLAPFHTLKKCFQSKLVDLYTLEKMKNLNHRIKMAKQHNMSFEYDILEMESLPTNVKKEGNASKRSKKSRSASYCQCPRNREMPKINQKNDRNLVEEIISQGVKKMNARKNFSVPRDSKRRKLNPLIDLKMSGPALEPPLDLHDPDRFHPSDANISSSAVSSPSKSDTWETYSNYPSCKEERMQGSVAISTTSFDSCLERFDSANLNDTRAKYRKHPQKSRRNQGRVNAEFHKKPTADTSRHLIVNVDRKNSDDQIVDFMDREPQSQVITTVESNRKWQPLRRQSRPKEKKPEKEVIANYFLRSLSSSREKIPGERNTTFLHGNLQEVWPTGGNFHIEIGTQVGESNLELTRSSSPVKNSLGQMTLDTRCASVVQEETPEGPAGDSNLQSSGRKSESPPLASAPDVESPGESSHSRSFDLVEEPPECFQNREVDGKMNTPRRHSERPSAELAPGFRGMPAELQQPLDDRCNYIFGEGARENSNRLGESCEFSFGLNWVSDDED